MSNHIHLVLRANNKTKFPLSDIIRDFKKFTARKILEEIRNEPEMRKDWIMHMFKYYAKYNTNNREFQLWEQYNHPKLLISQEMTWQKVNYIHQNPVRAGIVENASDYLYSSARNYERENLNCLMEIDLLEPWWSEVGRV